MEYKHHSENSMGRQFMRSYFIVSLIPLILLLFLVISVLLYSRIYIADLITMSNQELNKDAEKNLQQLGEQVILLKARDVAQQIDLYFRMHPNQSIPEMRKDPLFMKLAIQKVGETGYTAMTEAFTYLFRVHPNPKLNDTNFKALTKQLPEWGKIVEGAIDGDETTGYYNWKDPDGRIRKKYLATTPVKTRVKGIIIMVSATTYIDEFSKPVQTMRYKADQIISNYQGYITRQWFYFGLIATFVLLITYSWTYFMGRKTAFKYMFPIMQLSEMARQFGEGNWDASAHTDVIQRKDEIGILGQTLSHMSVQLKSLFSSLEQRVEELKKTQQALSLSEERFSLAMKGSNDGLWDWVIGSPEIYLSPRFKSILGFEDNEMENTVRAWEKLTDPRDFERVSSMITDYIKGKIDHFEIEYNMQHKKGHWIRVLSRAHLLRDNKGWGMRLVGTHVDMTELRKAEHALIASEERHRMISEISSDYVYLIDLDKGTYPFVRWVSGAYTEITGYTVDEINKMQKKWVSIIHPDDIHLFKFPISNQFSSEIPQEYEYRIIRKDKEIRWLADRMQPLFNENQTITGIIGAARNITERKKAEEAVKKSLHEKEILLKELYHRTKNNMQVINAMLTLQAESIDNEQVKDIFLETENRIHSMALVHQKLYESKDLSMISLKEYIIDLTNDLMYNYHISEKTINLELDLEDISVLIDTAIPCGLIINELVSNIFKHAFEGKNAGNFSIALSEGKDGIINLIIADNGRGFPADFNPRKSERFGLQTVFGIIENQLDGTIQFTSDKGVTWKIQFKDELYKQRI